MNNIQFFAGLFSPGERLTWFSEDKITINTDVENPAGF
jgi:hypothetical protein